MAAQVYMFSVRNHSTGGARITGLAPAWETFVTEAGANNIGSAPAISEIGNGQYKFSWDAVLNGGMIGQIDADPTDSASLDDGDRYIDYPLPADTGLLATYLNYSVNALQLRVPAALVSGRMDASVGAMANNVMTAAAAASDFSTEFVNMLLDLADSVETGITVRKALRGAVAALLGTTTGVGSATVTFKGAGVATTRITATIDANKNRTAITLNL